MATRKPNNIDEIHDIGEMVEVMNALGITWRGLTTVDKWRNRVKDVMRKRVKDKLHQSEEESSWTAGEVSIDIRIIQMTYSSLS